VRYNSLITLPLSSNSKANTVTVTPFATF
jgi:hypothetical protein